MSKINQSGLDMKARSHRLSAISSKYCMRWARFTPLMTTPFLFSIVKNSYLKLLLCNFFSFLLINATNASGSDDTYPAILGNGYDSLKLEHRMFECTKGEVKSNKTSEVIVNFNKVESWSRLNSQLNFQIPGSIYLKSDTELGKFVLRAKDTHLTSTYILDSKVTTEKKVLLNPQLIIDKHDEDFRHKCGTQFISLVEMGGELHVGIKFNFSKKDHKENFDSGSTITSLTGLGTHIDGLSNEVRKSTSMEIFFHQTGGNIKDINEMFKSTNITQCSLVEFKKCQELIEGIWDYATNQFVTSVRENTEPTSVYFRTSDYVGRPSVFEEPKVIRERKFILDALNQNSYDRDMVSAMLLSQDEYEDCDGRCLSMISSKISANLRDLKGSVRQSFLDPDGFKDNGVLDMLELQEYDFPKKKINKHQMVKGIGRYIAAGITVAAIVPIIIGIFTKGYGYWNKTPSNPPTQPPS